PSYLTPPEISTEQPRTAEQTWSALSSKSLLNSDSCPQCEHAADWHLPIRCAILVSLRSAARLWHRTFMQIQGNTILITGGTSGIGRGLAEAFHQRGNQVIITRRRQFRLKEMCHHHPGMVSYVLDVTSPESIQSVARAVLAECPKLNCVINNAGIQMHLSLAPDSPL